MMQTGRDEFQTEFARKYVALGRETSLRQTLARQVSVKFGPEALPPVERGIEAAEIETLERWLERIITATTIDDVFGA
jgi:hypothetical protein